eukprot:SAG31_NODE_609_length_13567_cov_18.101574_2_plen_250_part_00
MFENVGLHCLTAAAETQARETEEQSTNASTNQDLQQKISKLRSKLEEQRRKLEPTERRLKQALEKHGATMVEMDALQSKLDEEKAKHAKAEEAWKAWKTRAERQISDIQCSVAAEAKQNAAREAELSRATTAAGDALLDQQQCREQLSELQAENQQLRSQIQKKIDETDDEQGKSAANRAQNAKLRAALESLMTKHKQVTKELQARKQEINDIKRDRRTGEIETASLREQLDGQHEQIGTIDALQSMLV